MSVLKRVDCIIIKDVIFLSTTISLRLHADGILMVYFHA